MSASPSPLQGLMQAWSLTTDKLLDHAARWHGFREVVARRPDGTIGRTTYAALRDDAKRMSNALLARGVRPGDRVATLAMNGIEHLCAWYAITGVGAVCHTLNPRLSEDQLAFIVNHAEDALVLADGAFAPVLARLQRRCPTMTRIILLSPGQGDAPPGLHVESFEAVIAGASPGCAWGGFDEQSAAGLCYTSGTTGDPKGVLYSHRSNVLHALMTLQSDVFGFSVNDTVLPMVPMYHANAWGIAHSAPAVGARLALPGPALDGAALFDLIAREAVTVAAGVPTVWLALVHHMQANGLRAPSLERAIVGGAAASARLIGDLKALGIEPMHLWGMTEMSPVGTSGVLTPEVATLDFEAQTPWRICQGRPPFGVDMKLVDDKGEMVAHDGVSPGALHVSGPAVAARYYRVEHAALDSDGGFDTGDIATIDPLGFMHITDRAKDLIKSGGEWISSIEVEHAALSHPKAALVAAIGAAHDKWGERPVVFIQLKPGEQASAAEFEAILAEKLPRWWVPDQIVFIKDLPLGATGKVDKKLLREIHHRQKSRGSDPAT
jgi:fatty-acyl-CoA synthase